MVNDDEPSSHNRRGKGRPDSRKLGRKRPGRSRASNTSRPQHKANAAASLRSPSGFGAMGLSDRRACAEKAKAEPAMKAPSNAVVGITGVRVAAWGEWIGRVNWGPSAAGGLDPQSCGIIHNPRGGRQRRRCGHSKRGSGRTLQPVGEPRATGPAVEVRSLGCRLDASPTTGKTPWAEITTVAVYKPAGDGRRRWPRHEAGLKPYWGKPTVRNFRGGGGNEVHGLTALCHDARKG